MSLVALSREYPSIFKAPVLRQVDPRIFSLHYFRHCMTCGFCKDQCCSYGVDIDEENIARLRGLGDDFKTFVGVREEEWFGAEIFDDVEFPSGHHRHTRVRDGRCVFHDPRERGCKIHAWSLQKGLDYHLYKPMVSILFPLTFNYGLLEPSSEVTDGSLACSGDGASLYDGARDELRYFFGHALVGELDTLKTGFL